jgi:DNA-binding PadR family transcriptional regulator
MAPKRPLPATGYAVLGLLSFGRELSGYDVKKWADTILSLFYWSPAVSQVYGELKRLEELGFVTSREVSQDDQRTKRVYRITPEGLAELRSWALREEVEPPVLKHSTVLRVWLGHLGDPEQVADLVRRHVDLVTERLGHAAATLEAAGSREFGEYPVLVARWSVGYYEAELALAHELLRLLEDLAPTSTP